jgi:hypothetical protein
MTQALKMSKLGRVRIGNRFTHNFNPAPNPRYPAEFTIKGFMPSSYANRVLTATVDGQEMLFPLNLVEELVAAARVM